MKKFYCLVLGILCLCLFGCGKQDTWQGAYYYGGTDDTNIVWGPVFSTFEGCRDWAYNIELDAYEQYTWCSKNCHDSKAGMPICEEVIRSRHPLPGFGITFDEYRD